MKKTEIGNGMFAVGDTYVSDYVDYVVGQSLDDKVAEVEQVKEDVIDETTAITDDAIRESIAIRNQAEAEADRAKSEADKAKVEADRIKGDADRASAYADEALTYANRAEDEASSAQLSANLATEQAQLSSSNRVSTAADRQTVEEKTTETAGLTEQTRQYNAESKATLEEQKRLIANAPAWYFKASIEAMQAIANPKEKDICYILGDAAKSDVYAYFINDIHGEPLSAPAWVWIGDFVFTSLDKETLLGILQLSTVAVSGEYSDLVNIPNKYDAPVVLDGTGETVVWDYSQSENALVTLTENKPIQINNLYPGAEGKIQVYGGLLEIPEGERNPLYGMVEPITGQEHAVYSFYSRDGVQKDWNMLPYKGASANVS